MKTQLINLLIFSILPVIAKPSSGVKFGAIFRSEGDEHLIEAFMFAVQQINEMGTYGKFDSKIDFIPANGMYKLLDKEDDKIVALFGSPSTAVDMQLSRLSKDLQLPYFTVHDDSTITTVHTRIGEQHYSEYDDLSTKIEMFPKWHLMESLTDLIMYWGWKKITVVYTDSNRIRRLAPLLEDSQYENIRIGILQVKNGDYLAAANRVKDAEECRIVPKRDCEENTFNRVWLDMEADDVYKFMLADINEIDLNLFRHNHARIVGMTLLNKNTTDAQPGAALIEATKKKWKEKRKESKYFPVTQTGLIYDAVLMAAVGYHNWTQKKGNILQKDDFAECAGPNKNYKHHPHGREIFYAIRNTTITGITGPLTLSQKGTRKNSFLTVNMIGYAGNLDEIGYWEPHLEVQVNLTKDTRAHMTHNLKVSEELKPHFRVTTILERPYIMYRRNHYDYVGNMKFEGFCIDLLQSLAIDLGFTYTLHEVKDKKYGNADADGEWNGMIGEILRGEADMAVAPLTVNFKRAEVVDFTKPFLSLGISILFKIPDDQQPDLFSFLNPLSREIWFWILVAAVCITLGMYCVARLTPYEWNLNFSCCTAHQPQPACDMALIMQSQKDQPPNPQQKKNTFELANNYSFWNTMWYVTSTMLKGGCDFGPRAVSTRLLGGTWWIFTLVITSAYTANLAAVLTVSRTYIPIKNLDELSNQSSIAYGTIKGGSTMQFFQESRIKTHVKMWEYMKDRAVFVKNNGEGVERVTNENYAYLMESTSLEYEVQQNCNLTQVGGVLGSKGYGIALQKKSEWTDRISRQILLYAKQGVIEMKKQKWWRSRGAAPCTGPGSSVKEQRLSLNMQNVSGLFVILFVGLATAVLSVIIEFCIRSRQNSKIDKKPFYAEVAQELRFALKLNDARTHRSRRMSRNPSVNQSTKNTRLTTTPSTKASQPPPSTRTPRGTNKPQEGASNQRRSSDGWAGRSQANFGHSAGPGPQNQTFQY